jgi:DNA polymerase-1
VLPNVRKLFQPDPGYVIFDADLAGADAQVVAWEANDEELKQAFREGLDVHSHNAATMLGDKFTRLSLDDPLRDKLRKQNKGAVHATNYGAHPRTLAINFGWLVSEAEDFQRRWFGAHPGIKDWQERTDTSVSTTGTIRNKFGYHITFYDRPRNLLPKALAWVPQSTVALVCFKGALQIEKHLGDKVEFLLQVHDSLVFQIKWENIGILPKIKELLAVPVPYDDPLTIPWGLARSETSWGDVVDVEW